jgi:hypothetical protein
LIGVVAAAMAFPGCAMDGFEKGAYNATRDGVEQVKTHAGAKETDVNNLIKKVGDAKKDLAAMRFPAAVKLSDDVLAAVLLSPDEPLLNCGMATAEYNALKGKIDVKGDADVYAGVAAKLFLPLLEGMGDKLNGAAEFKGYDGVNTIPYEEIIGELANEEACPLIGKFLLQISKGLVEDKDAVKHLIGLFGNRVGTALIQNKLKLSDVKNSTEVLKSLIIMSNYAIYGNAPSQPDKDKYGTFKALLDVAPEFIKSLEEKGGLNGLKKTAGAPTPNGGSSNPTNQGNGTNQQQQMQQQQQQQMQQQQPSAPVKILKSGRKREKK